MTVLFLTILTINFTLKTLIFFTAIILVIAFLPYTVKLLFKRFENHFSELETKFLLLFLIGMGALASWAQLEAVLPAYLIGMVLAKAIGNKEGLIIRLRTLTFGFLTPFYFISVGLLVSIPALLTAPFTIIFLFFLKIISKAIGIYPVANLFRMRRIEAIYSILLMSTGLTFGSIAALFGLTHKIINTNQYSSLICVIIASALFPTVAAYLFFKVNKQKKIIQS
jgi:Kef-type K+ transport system membrane component KefB